MLTPEELMLVSAMEARLSRLAELAEDLGVSLMIDAEHSYFQLAIDRIVLQMQRKHNRSVPRIYNTFQCYLTAARPKAAEHMAHADREGWHFAAKVVRGAYVALERERAGRLGLASPAADSACHLSPAAPFSL